MSYTDIFVGGTATASTFWPGYPASLAFDKNDLTRWTSATGTVPPHWIMYTLASPMSVTYFTLKSFTDLTKDFLIQGDNGDDDWVTLVDAVHPSDSGEYQYDSIDQGTIYSRYRLYISTGYTVGTGAIYEWVAYSSNVFGKKLTLKYGDLIGLSFRVRYGDVPIIGKAIRILCGQAPIRGKKFQIKYDQARVVGKRFRISYQSAAAVGKKFIIKYQQSSGIVGKLFKIIYESSSSTPVGKLFRIIYQSAVAGFHLDQVAVSVSVSSGQQLKSIISISTGRQEENYPWECTIALTDEWEATLLDQFEPVTLNRYGTEYSLLVVDRGRTEQVGDGYSDLWEIKLASPTYMLSVAAAVPITKTWPSGTSAKVIVQEICDLYGITLDWQAPEYVIGELVAARQAPIEIIRTVLNVIGALQETLPNGTLAVRKEFPVLPLPGVVTDYTVTGLDISSIQQPAADPSLLYNYVVVGSESDAVGADGGGGVGLNHEEIDRSDGGKDIKAWAAPWAAVTISPNAGATEVTLTGGGIVEEEIEEWLEFVGGEAATSKSVYTNFELIEYRGADPGSISWELDSNEIIAGAGGEYYCMVRYKWRYYSFIYYSLTGKDYQVILEK